MAQHCDGSLQDSESEVVKVQFVLQKRQDVPGPKEVVRMCTAKGNEVVDVAGFTFIRKRKAEDPADAPSGSSGAATHAACPQDQPSPCRQHQPPDAGMSAGEEAEAAGQLLALEQLPSSTAGAPQQTLAEEVQGLLQYLPTGCPKAVAAQWLVDRTLRLAAQRAGGGEASAAEAAALSAAFAQALDGEVSAARALLLGGFEDVQRFEQLPPLVRELCAGERVAAGLRQQLRELQAEEHAWRQLEGKYASGAQQQQPAGAQPGPAPLVVDVPAVDVQPLADAQSRANMELEMQVEAITSMVDKAEVLVARAEQACALLQADYHKEHFQAYPHINSPLVLVKLLSQHQADARLPQLGS